MPIVTLRIEPEICGPLSIGTARVIKLVAEHLALSLVDAMQQVDRCVFDGEAVEILAPSAAAAERFMRAVAALPPVPRVFASLAGPPE
jgi:hypothetical protein